MRKLSSHDGLNALLIEYYNLGGREDLYLYTSHPTEGTLRIVFQDAICLSWDEAMDHVGKLIQDLKSR